MSNKYKLNAIFLGFAQLISLLLPFLVLPYLSRVLGSADLGRVAFAIAVGQVFFIISEYGFNLSGPKLVVANKNSRHDLGKIFLSISFVRIFISMACVACLFFLSMVFDKINQDFELVLASSVALAGGVLFPQWLYIGLEKVGKISIINIISRAFAFGLVFVVVDGPDDIILAIFLQMVGGVIAGLLSLPFLIRELDFGSFRCLSFKDLKFRMLDGWYAFLSTSAIAVYTTANVMILGLLVSPAALANYHVAEKLIRGMQSAYGPLSNAIFPHVQGLIKSNELLAKRFVFRMMIFLGFASVFVSAVLYFYSGVVLVAIFGSEYYSAEAMFKVFLVMFPISIFANIFCVHCLAAFGYEKKMSHVLMTAAVFDIMVFTALSYFFGGIGASVANLIVELFVFLYSGYFVYKYIGIHFGASIFRSTGRN